MQKNICVEQELNFEQVEVHNILKEIKNLVNNKNCTSYQII